MSTNLAIVGIGGMGRDLLALVHDLNAREPRFDVVGFLDDDPAAHGRVVNGIPVLGGIDWVADNGPLDVAVAVGSPSAKRRIVDRLRPLGAAFPTIVHPSAVVGTDVALGEGTMIGAGCVVTTNVELDGFVIVNVLASVSHDVRIARYATLAPGVHLSGSVHIGEGAEVGIGAVAIQGVSIGAWSIIGAGAVVTEDLPADVTAVGVPARVIKQRRPGWHL